MQGQLFQDLDTAGGTFNPAKEARDAVLARVAQNSAPWIEQAVGAFRASAMPDEFTGEMIRGVVEKAIGQPHHHNAWGALTMTLARRKLIEATGAYTAMRSARSHARSTRLYRRAK